MPSLTKTQRFWLNHINAAHKSRKSYSEYCRQHKISANALYNAKKKLIKFGALSTDTGDATNVADETTFVKANVVKGNQPTGLPHQTIRVQFPNGIEMSIPMKPGTMEKMLGLMTIS